MPRITSPNNQQTHKVSKGKKRNTFNIKSKSQKLLRDCDSYNSRNIKGKIANQELNRISQANLTSK
jgi:hypothetical protein